MNRLEFLASLTKGSKSVLDIGSDHAYTVVYAVKSYGVMSATAADVNEGPLLNAKINIKNFNLSDKIDTILSDGFENIDREYDTVVISGMGGKLISNILELGLSKRNNFNKFILQANSDKKVLREFLNNNNFLITNEYLLKDNKKYYTVIVATKGNMQLTDLELEFGPILLQNKGSLFTEMYEKKLDLLTKNLVKTKEGSHEKLNKKINRIKKILGS